MILWIPTLVENPTWRHNASLMMWPTSSLLAAEDEAAMHLDNETPKRSVPTFTDFATRDGV